MKHDLFISHASEDKADVVRPLVQALASLGLRVWYDEDMIKGGDSIREAIDHGLRDTRNAVVVLSPAFLSKRWTKWELNALVQRFNQSSPRRRGRLIPIWHNLTEDQVRQFSPPLADIAALRSADGIDTISLSIRDLVIPRTRVSRKSPRRAKVDRALVEACATAFQRFLREGLKSQGVALSVYLVDERGASLSLTYPRRDGRASSFTIPSQSARPRGLTAWVAKVGKPISVAPFQSIGREPPRASWLGGFTERESIRSMIAAPIKTGGGASAGVFYISSTDPGLFERERAFLLDMCVPMVSSVLRAALGLGDDKNG